MIPPPLFPNPNETDAERMKHIEARLGISRTRCTLILGGGLLALLAFAVCAVMGLPGAGVVLVPIGLGMLLGGGIELLVSGLS